MVWYPIVNKDLVLSIYDIYNFGDTCKTVSIRLIPTNKDWRTIVRV